MGIVLYTGFRQVAILPIPTYVYILARLQPVGAGITTTTPSLMHEPVEKPPTHATKCALTYAHHLRILPSA